MGGDDDPGYVLIERGSASSQQPLLKKRVQI